MALNDIYKKNYNLCLFAFLLLVTNTHAQNLPNKQEISLRAPSNIKIDGKATEWNSQFQAYNKAVDVFYTISNDDENLYLIIHANKKRIIEKILDVGVTLTINNTAKKKDDDPNNITITFPNIEPLYSSSILMKAGAKENSSVPIPVIQGRPADTSNIIIKSNDSLKAVANKLLATNARIIKIKGLKEIQEEEISVYNDQKIVVAESFDSSAAYTYELSVPLKNLGLNAISSQKFSYNIKLQSRFDVIKVGMRTRFVYPNGIKTDVDQDLDSTTDFWGELTLAKK